MVSIPSFYCWGAQVQSLVKEVKYCKPCSAVKKQTKTKQNKKKKQLSVCHHHLIVTDVDKTKLNGTYEEPLSPRVAESKSLSKASSEMPAT